MSEIKSLFKNCDLYGVLGLDKDCTNEQIRKSYLKLSLRLHPDKNTNLDEASKKLKEEEFKYVKLVYTFLVGNRTKYDQKCKKREQIKRRQEKEERLKKVFNLFIFIF